MYWLLFSRNENAPAACIHVKMLRYAVIDDTVFIGTVLPFVGV